LNSIDDADDKAKTQKKIAEFYFEVKDLDHTIEYATPALVNFTQNVGNFISHADKDPQNAGEISYTLQYAKFLKGLYAQSIEHGKKAKAWYKTEVAKADNNEAKKALYRKYVEASNYLGQSYMLKGDLGSAETVFTQLNDELPGIYALYAPDAFVSRIFDSNAKTEMHDEILAYQAITNYGLALVNLAQGKIANARAFSKTADEAKDKIGNAQLRQQSINQDFFVQSAIKFADKSKNTSDLLKDLGQHYVEHLKKVADKK
jgi:tetratricopeptide (TPR) repeat protein